MAANMARNICSALKRMPIVSVTVWMDSLVALFWISNPAKSWKVFVSNRVRKIAAITAEVGIQWKYCPTKEIVADLGSRGATINRMERGGWFTGPEWLLDKVQWPDQPKLTSTKDTDRETTPIKETVYHFGENVRNLNNRPLTYVESDHREENILTPNVILWGTKCIYD